MFLGVTMRYKYYVLLIAIGGILTACCRILYRNACTIKQINITIDGYVNQELKKQITAYIHKKSRLHQLPDLKNKLQRLKPKFPIIADFTLAHDATGTTTITITTHKPNFRINTAWTWSPTIGLLPRSYYNEQHIQKLKKIHLAYQDDFIPVISPECTAFLQALPQKICQNYAIYWIDAYTSEFIDKAYPQLLIRCHGNHIPTDQEINHIQHIKNKLITTAQNKNDSFIRWIADLRFTHQIIVRKEKRENNGTRTI